MFVGRVDLASVRGHVADTAGDVVEQLSHGLVQEVLLVQVGGRHPGALEQGARALVHHPLPAAVHAVARRAVDAEALATALHRRVVHLDLRRERLGEGAADLASIEVVVVAQFAAGRDKAERPCTYCNRCLLEVVESPLGCYDESRFPNRDAMLREVLSVFQPPPFQ